MATIQTDKKQTYKILSLIILWNEAKKALIENEIKMEILGKDLNKSYDLKQVEEMKKVVDKMEVISKESKILSNKLTEYSNQLLNYKNTNPVEFIDAVTLLKEEWKI